MKTRSDRYSNGQKIACLLVLLAAVAPLPGCSFLDTFVPKKGETTDVIDRQQNLSVNDFRDLNKTDALFKNEPIVPTAALGAPPVPDLAQVLAAPHPPKVANTKLVTIAVTEDVPLRDVLFELGRLAKVDIEVGSGLDTTGINLRATDQPFNEVIERIARLAHLRYSVDGNAIKVERDLPYIKNYSLDFLNIVRSTTSTYSLSTNILSSSSGGSGSGGSSSGSGSSSSGSGSSSSGGSSGSGSNTSGFGTTGSTSNITSAGESDLFSSLEASISEIISYSNDDAQGASAAGGKSGTSASKAGGMGMSGAGAGGSSGSGTGQGLAGENFVVNRQSNVLTVNATEAQHELIQRFLTLMGRNSSAQVLIEAKIVEVELADQYLAGVNWNSIIGDTKHFISPGSFIPGPIDALGLPTASSISTQASAGTLSNAFTFGIQNSDLNAVVAATQQFGTTRTLSSPRLSAINNQQAVLTFARNEIFFNCTATQGAVIPNTGTTGSVGTQPTVNCDQSTVPIGIIMSILPSVNLNTQEVTLNIRPTLTRQVSTVQNPGNILAAAVAFGAGGVPAGVTINADVPIIEVRELDSVMKVKSGGVMVIGGLMEDSSRNTDIGVPGLNEVPILGNLFKSRSDDSLKHELIIFVKATIVNPDGSSDSVDHAVYNKYVTDPRPLFPK